MTLSLMSFSGCPWWVSVALASAARMVWQSQSNAHTFVIYDALYLTKAGFFILDSVASYFWGDSVAGVYDLQIKG